MKPKSPISVLSSIFGLLCFVWACASPQDKEGDQVQKANLSAQTLSLPKPSGPHAVGVSDFEFVDVDREEFFRPGAKRRLMARVWYPAERIAQPYAPYMSHDEYRAIVDNMRKVLPLPDMLVTPQQEAMTNSLIDAPIAKSGPPYPIVIFSHGALGHVNTNVTQMEHFASHGYIIVSVSHPYTASAVKFPNGEIVVVDKDLAKDYAGNGYNDNIITSLTHADPSVRYKARRKTIDDHPLTRHAAIWRDDMISVVDAIEQQVVQGHAGDIFAHADLSRLGYMGMSFGGGAALSAAHIDPRARAAINLDGGNYDLSLFDASLRVPALIIHSDTDKLLYEIGLPAFHHSEFSYERHLEMGRRGDIIRLEIKGAAHLDFTDMALYPPSIREESAKLSFLGDINGARMTEIVNAYSLNFFDYYLHNDHTHLLLDLDKEYEEIIDVDLSYIRKWAADAK